MTARTVAFVVVVAAGCWTSPEPRVPEPAPPPTRRATAQPLCGLDPDTTDATAELACANERFAARDLDAADRVAADVMKRFPYSQRAISAEELRADILVRRGRRDDAAAAYATWLEHHPTNARAEAVLAKQAKLSAGDVTPP